MPWQLLSVGVDEGDMEARRMHWDSVPAALLHRHVIPCRFAALQSSGDEEEVQAGSSIIPPVALPAHQQQDLPTGRALVVLLRHVSRSRKHRKGHEEVEEEEEADEELQRIKAETSPRRYKAWVKHARSGGTGKARLIQHSTAEAFLVCHTASGVWPGRSAGAARAGARRRGVP